jgi:hypothetical protein
MFNLFPKKKSVDKITEDTDLTPSWAWTPTQTPSILQAQNNLIEQFLKENHDLKLENQKLKNEIDELKAQKHPMYPLHWMGLDPLIHEQAKDLTIEESIDKVKQKTPWVEEPIDWKGEKSWEEAASDLALKLVKLEQILNSKIKT